MSETETRTLGNGLAATEHDRGALLVTSTYENKIDIVRAVNALRTWFDSHDVKVVFQATEPGKGYWRYWNGRFWARYNDVRFRSDIDWLFSLNPEIGLTDKRLVEVVNTLKNKLSVPYEEFDRKPIVVFSDRVLEIRNQTVQTYERGFRPEDLITTGIPLCPINKPTPIWDSMLELILPNPDDQATLQECFGYSFFPQLSLQVFFILHGVGGTGKDTTLSVLRAMIGEDRVSAVPLGRLGKAHAGQGMTESIINVDMEAENLDRAGELILKMLSGDSPVFIDPKFMKPYSRTLPVKFILACNKLPHFSDKTNAIWDRHVQIPFKVQIPQDRKRKTIKQLVADLEPEFDGILHWGIEGLNRVLKTGKSRAAAFTQSAEALAEIAEHKRNSNTFLIWFDERCEPLEEGKESKDDLYADYKRWHLDNGYRNPLAKNSFGKELLRLGVGEHKPHRGPRLYQGIRLCRYGVRLAEEPAPGGETDSREPAAKPSPEPAAQAAC